MGSSDDVEISIPEYQNSDAPMSTCGIEDETQPKFQPAEPIVRKYVDEQVAACGCRVDPEVHRRYLDQTMKTKNSSE